MTIYEFVTPSDAITFKTDDEKIAYACTVILSEGKAGCKDTTTGKSLPTMLFLSSNAMENIKAYLGMELPEYMDENKEKISACFKSFAYTTPSTRAAFDAALSSLTDEKEVKKFLEKHEDKRSSMSRWVKAAWQYGEVLLKKEKTTA